ncbi:MAG: FAD-dependent oxidoreductase, partial [Kiritimatiellae bacterium]|nr:FAD-dependent oxidoreductase [Kiritimatiellia bacterium]
AGAKVALIERYGSLGGLFTNGMVLIMLSPCRKDGSGWSLVTRGVCEEFMKRCGAYGKAFSNPPESVCPKRHWQPTVDPECAKVVMDAMIAENGVEMFFHSWGVDVVQDGAGVLGVVFESKEGRQAVLAKQVVDCTGDADMLFRAGGDYRQITHSIGFVSRWANMDRVKPPAGAAAKFPQRGNEGNPSTGWYSDLGPKGNGLSVRDLSAAEVYHRARNWKKVLEMRRTPGWEEVFTANTCSQIGPRASRLIEAEFVVGRREIASGAGFDDPVGWCGHDGAHGAFQVPYRQLVPKSVDNLLCAGRCLGRGDTIDTFRLICPCFVTGQAAGVAAALAAKRGVAPRRLGYAEIRRELERQHVMI